MPDAQQHDEHCWLTLDKIGWRIIGQTPDALIVRAPDGLVTRINRPPDDIGQHDDHPLLTLFGRAWKIGGKDGDVLWITDRYGQSMYFDASGTDWARYCAVATTWLENFTAERTHA